MPSKKPEPKPTIEGNAAAIDHQKELKQDKSRLVKERDSAIQECRGLQEKIEGLIAEKINLIKRNEQLRGEVKLLSNKLCDSGLIEIAGFMGSCLLIVLGAIGKPSDGWWLPVYYGLILVGGGWVLYSSFMKLIKYFFSANQDR